MAAEDEFETYAAGLDSPPDSAESVTPSDGDELVNVSRYLWIGGAGNVAVVTATGDAVTLEGATAGTLLPIRAKQVKSTGTTATAIVSLY